jgi:hypothetical protein
MTLSIASPLNSAITPERWAAATNSRRSSRMLRTHVRCETASIRQGSAIASSEMETKRPRASAVTGPMMHATIGVCLSHRPSPYSAAVEPSDLDRLLSLLSLLSRTHALNFPALALTRRRRKKSSIYLFQKWPEAAATDHVAQRGGPSDNSDNSANRSTACPALTCRTAAKITPYLRKQTT